MSQARTGSTGSTASTASTASTDQAGPRARRARRAGKATPAAATAQWEALAAEAFLGMKEWRLQHPTATFAEIEVAVDERLSAVRARMLEDVALASAAATMQATPLGARPACPACATSGDRGRGTGRLEARGQHAREVSVTYGRTVTLTRDYAVCSVCGTGLFPPG